MEIEEKVITMPAAYTLQANTPQSLVEQAITWDELRQFEIGFQWRVDGGGSLYTDWQRATLVYRDEVRAVLMVESYYSDDRSLPRTEKKLLGFAW